MSTPDDSLAGQVALVTGAAGFGIGTRTAQTLAGRGVTVVLNGTNAAELRAAAETVASVGSTPCQIVADVSDSAAVERMFEEILKRFGRIDILVNNASRASAPRPFYELSDVEWRRDIDATLSSAFYCARGAALSMIRQRRGRIIFVSSMSGLRGSRARAASYAAAKAALFGLTRQLALELGVHQVTVNAVAPSFVDTPRARRDGRRTDESIARYVASQVPLQRAGMPDDVAQLIAFVASDRASYLTGQVLVLDGGSSLANSASIVMDRQQTIGAQT